MYKFHPTPNNVVTGIIKKHLPRKAIHVLEPSVGDGALINGICLKKNSLLAVDLDPSKVSYIKNFFSGHKLNVICANFLELNFSEEKFDLVICNPPFDGKNCITYQGATLPLEAAFLLKSISLCKDNGRLIFVLPCSVVQGSRLSKFREMLCQQVQLKYSYKLSKFAFTDVEGEFSVLIFDKNVKPVPTVFISQSGYKIVGEVDKVTDTWSFDAEEIHAEVELKSKLLSSEFRYVEFDSVFNVTRGKVTSDYNSAGHFHTTNVALQSKCSLSDAVKSSHKIDNPSLICFGDFYIKRVSRGLCDSLSIYSGDTQPFTDCIIKITPKQDFDKASMFFSLMVLLQDTNVKNILQKGSGAKYLDVRRLKKLQLPTGLESEFKIYYLKFIDGNHEDRIEIARKINLLLSNKKIPKVISSEKLQVKTA